MLKIRSFALYAALVALAACSMAAGRAPAAAGNQGPGAESKLIAVLKSDAPPQDKAITCKQLAIYGSPAAVPALAALLPDKELSSWARIALEAIPGPAADDALRAAMNKVQGRLLIGVINSIGVRRDAKAVGGLVAKLKDADADVASAAAAALGRIGGATAAQALVPMLATAPGGVRPSVAEGCILCAERFLADDNRDEAVKLYDTVRKADLPKQKVLEATRGAILARGAAGVPLLVEQLKSTDNALFGIGLRTARELPGPEATEAVATEMSQALMLIALADRGDAKALPAVLKVAKTGATHVRMAAMAAIDRFGNASCVPALLEVAIESDADLAQRAKGTLARLAGQDVDADLVARLPQAAGKTRQAVIEVAGQRRIMAALPAIVKCAEDADAGVRSAAIEAIGAMGDDKQVADLVRLLSKAADSKEQATIEKVLMTLCSRGGPACAAHLVPLTRGGESAVRIIALHALACAGGPQALAAVKAAIADKDEAVQDEAMRTLSTWPSMWPDDAAAGDALLGLAKSAKKTAHQVLALRGYLNYVHETKKLGDDERLARINAVLPLATRPEEKRLVISAVGTIGSAGALDILGTLAGDPETSDEACSAILGLLGKKDLKGVSKQQRQKALQTVVEKSKNAGVKKKAEDALKAIK
ncbi:MAG: HEAT repeat domain-containing protein [Planctomycetota bacterium]|nr:HEAT repeat domain-containing protein [Planctomycetota bacterium]